MDILPAIEYVIEQGDERQLAVIGKSYPSQIAQLGYKDRIVSANKQYLEQIQLVRNPSGGIPFGYGQDHESGIFHTAQTVSTLFYLGYDNYEITKELLQWLVNQQHSGWWRDDNIISSYNPPQWQDPRNNAVTIFNTAYVLSVLATIELEDFKDIAASSITKLEQVTMENNTLIGFPQSTWVVTPAYYYYYGSESSRFTDHITVLDKFINDNPTTQSIITICRGLTQIDMDHKLMIQCIDLIEEYLGSIIEKVQSKHNEHIESLSLDQLVSALLCISRYLANE